MQPQFIVKFSSGFRWCCIIVNGHKDIQSDMMNIAFFTDVKTKRKEERKKERKEERKKERKKAKERKKERKR